MSWEKVILIITAVIAMVIAIYFLLGILGVNLAEIFVPTKPYQELTSMAALACAVDVVGTQDIGVKTCDRSYKWGEVNVFETITGYFVRAKYLFTGNAVGASKDFDVICMPNPSVQYASPTKKGFLCESRRGDKSFVECWKENDRWKCKVIGFYLEQKFSTEVGKSVIERAYYSGVETLEDVVKSIREKRIEPWKLFAWFGKLWIGEMGEPKYLIYYETFPASMEGIWTIDTSDVAISTMALGGVINTAFSAFEIFKAGGGAIKKGVKPLLHLHVRTAVREMKEAFVEAMWKELSKYAAVGFTIKHLIFGKILSSTALKEEVGERIGGEIMEELVEIGFKKDLPVFPAARGASRYFGLGDAAGDAFMKNVLGNVQAYAIQTGGKEEITKAMMREIMEKSVPDSLSKEAKEEFLKQFARGLGFETIDEASEAMVTKIVTPEILKKISTLEILDEAAKKELKESLAIAVKDMIIRDKELREAIVRSAVRGYEKKELLETFVKEGIMPEKFKKVYEEEVEKIATIAYQDAISKYKLAKLAEETVGDVGLVTQIKNSWVKGVEEANELAHKLGFKDFKTAYFEGLAQRLRVRIGAPKESWAVNLGILTGAAAYLYLSADTTTEKFETCGANSLCLHTAHFFKQNNYNISLTQNKMVVTEYESGNMFSWLGVSDPKKVRGFVVSPCKADLIIEDGETSCKGFVGNDVIAYTVPFSISSDKDTTYITFHTISPDVVIDVCEVNLPQLNRTNFWEELYSKGCMDMSTTFKIENYREYCKGYPGLHDCVRGDFLNRMEDVLKGRKKLSLQYEDKITPIKEFMGGITDPKEMKEEEKRQILLSVPYRIINVKTNVITSESEVITACEPPDDIPLLGWEMPLGGESRPAVIIKANRTSMKEYFEKDPEKNTNYCIPYEAKVDVFNAAMQAAQFVPWELVGGAIGSIFPAVGTAAGYAAGMAVNFAVGAGGAFTEHIVNQQMAWPNNQWP